MSRWNVRCSKEKCKLRYVFPKHPDEYDPPRKCAGCGGTRFRVIEDRAKDRCSTECDCAGRVYPDVKASNWSAKMPAHMRGSVGCWYNRDGTERPPEYFEGNDEPISIHQLESEPPAGLIRRAPMSGTASEITSWEALCAVEVVAEEVDHPAHYCDAALG